MMQHAPITTPITDKLSSMPWIRWFRQLVDRVEEVKKTADAPGWDTITGKPIEFPPSEHRHEWTDLDDIPTEFPPEAHTHPQYITEETDPTVPEHVKEISESDISRWDSTESIVSSGVSQITGVTGAPLGDLELVEYPPVIGQAYSASLLGGVYPTVVTPDNKEWMTKNLEYASLGELSGGGAAFGRLYSWSDCDTIRTLLSDGWRIPEYQSGTLTTEWQDLFQAAGIAGTEGRLRNPSLTYWADASNGENLYGFDLRGGGIEGGSFVTIVGRYWYLNNPGNPVGEYLSTNWVYNRINTGGGYVAVNYSKCSLRLVRDASYLIYYTISVPAFSVRLFDDDAFLTDAMVFDIPAQEIPVPGSDQRYYLCAQRSGETVDLVPVTQAEVYTINMSNIVPLWRFEIHGTEIHQIQYDNMGDGLPNKQEFAQLRTEPYRLAIEGGFTVTLGGGRSLTMTGAEVFFGHHRVSVSTFNSATDTVHEYYHVGGIWTDMETPSGWAWPNTTYDDGTDLVTMGNNKWASLFVYRSIGDSKEIFVVRGQSEANTFEAARLIPVPSVPSLIQWHCLLVGRLVFQKSASTGVFEQYSTATFQRSFAVEHNQTTGKQGGIDASDEFYHLSESANILAEDMAVSYSTYALEASGWEDPAGITVTYSTTNRTITLSHASGSLTYVWQGRRKSLASPWTSSAHSTGNGSFFLYSTDGTTFSWSSTPWIFRHIQVAFARVDSVGGFTLALREVHGAAMDAETHDDLHANIGTWTKAGGVLTAGTYAVGSATDADTTPGINETVIKDEDCPSTLPALVQGTYQRVYVASSIAYTNSGSFPFTSAGSYLQWYNAGVLTTGTTGKFYSVWAVAVPATADTASQAFRWLFIQPQAEHSTLVAAQAESFSSLDLGNLSDLVTEFCARFQIIYGTNAAFGNTGKCQIEVEPKKLTKSKVLSI